MRGDWNRCESAKSAKSVMGAKGAGRVTPKRRKWSRR